MPGPGRAPWPPSAITTSSGGCGSGHLTAGRPIITAASVRHVCSGWSYWPRGCATMAGYRGLGRCAASCCQLLVLAGHETGRGLPGRWQARRFCLGAAETDRAVRWPGSGAAAGDARSGRRGCAGQRLAQRPAPPGQVPRGPGCWGRARRPRRYTTASRVSTSASAIMTSAAVQAPGPVMWCATLKRMP